MKYPIEKRRHGMVYQLTEAYGCWMYALAVANPTKYHASAASCARSNLCFAEDSPFSTKTQTMEPLKVPGGP